MATYLQDIRQGDDYVLKFDYGLTNDITGFEFTLTVKESFSDTDANAVLQYSSIAGSDSADNPLIGIAYLRVPASITKNAQAGIYYYDVQVKTTTGNIATLIPPVDDYKDKVVIAPEVTRLSA